MQTEQHRWEIYLRVRGVAKGCRKVQYHSVDVATAEDNGTDESKPLLGGHDLQTMARKALDSFRKVEGAELRAMPVVYKNEGMFKSKQFQMFNSRCFGATVLDIDGKAFRKGVN